MGSGSSAFQDVKEKVASASNDDLTTCMKELSAEERARIKAALEAMEKPKEEGVWTPWIEESAMAKISFTSFFGEVKSDVAYVSGPEVFRKMHFGDGVMRLALKPGDGKEVFIQAVDLPTLTYKLEEREICFMNSKTGEQEVHKATGDGDAGKIQGMFKYKKADSWTPWLDLSELCKVKFSACEGKAEMSHVAEPEDCKKKYACYEINRMALKPGDGKEIFIDGKDLPSLTYEVDEAGHATAITCNGETTKFEGGVKLKGMFKHLRTDREDKPKDEGAWTPWIEGAELAGIKYVSFFGEVKSDVAYVSEPESYKTTHFGDAVTRLAIKPGDGKEVFIQAVDLPTLTYKLEEREICFMNSKTGEQEVHKATGDGDAGKIQGMFKYKKADSWTPWLDLSELCKVKFSACEGKAEMSHVAEPEDCKKKYACYEISRMALKPGYGKEIFIDGKDLPSLTYEVDEAGHATAITCNGETTKFEGGVKLMGMFKHLRK